MAKIIFIFLTFFSFSLSAQKNEVSITTPLMNYIYVGYDNVFKVNFSKKKIKKYKLECAECDTIYKVENRNNEWVIRVNSVKTIFLVVKNKHDKILNKTKIRSFIPPKPYVYIDSFSSQNVINKIPEKISLRLDESIPIMMGYPIKKWNIKIGNVLFTGVGNEISEEVKAYIKNEKSGLLEIEIEYRDLYSFKKIKEVIKFNLK